MYSRVQESEANIVFFQFNERKCVHLKNINENILNVLTILVKIKKEH